MKVVFENGKKLYNTFKPAMRFLDEVTIKFKKEGIEIFQLDPSRIVLLQTIIPKSEFLAYDVQEEQKITVWCKDLYNALKNITKNSIITIMLEKDYLTIGIDDKDIIHLYKLPTINKEDWAKLDIPDLPFTVTSEVRGDVLKKAVRNITSDVVVFKASKDRLIIEDKVDDKYSVFKYSADLIYFSHYVEEDTRVPVVAYYGTSYIRDALSGVDKKDIVILRFGEEIPILLKYGYNKFLIAPRIV